MNLGILELRTYCCKVVIRRSNICACVREIINKNKRNGGRKSHSVTWRPTWGGQGVNSLVPGTTGTLRGNPFDFVNIYRLWPILFRELTEI